MQSKGPELDLNWRLKTGCCCVNGSPAAGYVYELSGGSSINVLACRRWFATTHVIEAEDLLDGVRKALHQGGNC